MARASTTAELKALGASLLQPGALVELAALAGCVLLAWFVVRTIQRRRNHVRPESVLFGSRIFDGVLFPALALAFTIVAREVLDGVVPSAVLRIAVPVLMSLAAIRLVARVLRVALPRSTLIDRIERTVSWFAWIAVVLWITGLLPLLLEQMDSVQWKIGAREVTLRNLVEGALSAVVVMVAALWLASAIEHRLLRASGGVDMSLRKIAANVTRAALLFAGLLFALSAAGLDLTVLSVFGGALGVGIGFGLQKLASNYISGFVILAERSLRIGDWVKVDNFEGRVIDISTRYTVLRALNGREAVVPNEMLITQRIENYTRADQRIALTTSVLVGHGTDLEALIPRLADAVKALPNVVDEPAPNVQMSALTPDGIELTVQFWVADVTVNPGNAKSEVYLAVIRTLKAMRVEIPFLRQVVVAQQPQPQPQAAPDSRAL